MSDSAQLQALGDFLKATPAFAGCDKEDLARLLANISIEKLAAGERLCHTGDTADKLYYLLEGELETTNKDQVKGPISGFFGEESALGMRSYIYDIEVVDCAEVVVLPLETIKTLVRYSSFKQSLLDSFHARLAGQTHVEVDLSKQPEVEIGYRLLVGWLFALITPVMIYMGLQYSDEGLHQDAIYFASILGICSIMWIFRLLPDYVPGLFAVLSAVLLGITSSESAFSGFSSNSFFMALSILGLSAVIRSSGLSYRMLLHLLLIGPASKIWYNLSFFSVGALLTPVVPTVNGRVTIVAPFLKDLLSGASKEAREQEGPRLKASLLFGASLLSPIFVSSKSVNFIVLGMLPQQVQQYFQWLDWLIAAVVCCLVLLSLYVIALCWIYRNKQNLIIPKSISDQQLKTLGPLNPAEWSSILGLIVLIASLLFANIHRIEVAWVALAILFYLMMFGFLNPNQFRQKIDWSFLVFLGSLIGMVDIIHQVELDVWLTGKIYWLAAYMQESLALFVVMLALIVSLVRLVLPINATVVILATLLIPASIEVGVNPWVIGFLVLFLSESFFWPFQASYYMQFLSLTTGVVSDDEAKLMKMNIAIYLFKLIAVYASIPYWQSMGLI
ncbi:SLC13 family permease [Agarivorans sp. 1_MG-2023]|uniref:SLC13 family permease n=1 Tax=Agarivorans sp. 1_MG-2023 TaxID=3062634 RepID=UPI0026E18E02|nr:SLC13 family permease [Agarivorans sp. 1_MG-2023]MDO6762113.1 SLC13 family permease [Agarivorans sp. 1_MG-2023]